MAELEQLKEQVYKDPRPKEAFDVYHERTRTKQAELRLRAVRMLMSLISWIFFRARGYKRRARAGRRAR